MKTVFYIRHAKSSWKDFNLDDIDRTLNNRGRRDAPVMAVKLKALIDSDESVNLNNSMILSSNSVRTKETLELFNNYLGIEQDRINYDSNLYLADSDTLVEALFQVEDQLNCVFLFAHNPGLTILANQCRTTLVDNIPTCGIFRVDFNVSRWKEVDPISADSRLLMFPKMYD